MNNQTKIFVFTILICLTVTTVQSLPLNKEESSKRFIRDGFLGLDKLFRKTTEATTTTTKKVLMPNNLEIGKCDDDDKV